MSGWQVLVQFVFRLTYGVSLGMAMTPSGRVAGESYRFPLQILAGLNAAAAWAAAFQVASLPQARLMGGMGILLAALLCACSTRRLLRQQQYLGPALFGIGVVALLAAALATPWRPATSGAGVFLALLDLGSSGLVLGVPLSAIFLGAWHLGTPAMRQVPLKGLIWFLVGGMLVRTLGAAGALAMQADALQPLAAVVWVYVALRWICGWGGTALLVLFARSVLRVSGRPAAVVGLYAGIVLLFVGEAASQVLSVAALYPL